MRSDIGILNIAEYNALGILNYSDDVSYLYNYPIGTTTCNDSTELVMDLKHGIKSAVSYKGWKNGDTGNSLRSNKIFDQYIRPAFVIKGISNVISGNGTESSPYVIEGFVE